jgi:hypothetical protein
MGLKLLFGLGFLAAFSAGAQDATSPPAGEHAVLTVEGRGVQIYACQAGKWVFVAPAARLFDASGAEVGTHGDGPVWHIEDGSSVYGEVIAKEPSRDAESVPWLLLKAVRSTGAGKLAGVEFIRRSDTKGGAAPGSGTSGSGCDTGALKRVPYEATYTFYSAK